MMPNISQIQAFQWNKDPINPLVNYISDPIIRDILSNAPLDPTLPSNFQLERFRRMAIMIKRSNRYRRVQEQEVAALHQKLGEILYGAPLDDETSSSVLSSAPLTVTESSKDL